MEVGQLSLSSCISNLTWNLFNLIMLATIVNKCLYFSEFGTFSNTLFAVRFSVNNMKGKVTLVALLVACLSRFSQADEDKDVTADFIAKLADIGVMKKTGKDLAAPSNVDCKKDNFQLDHPYIVKCGSDVGGAMKDWMASAQTVQYPGATAPMSKCKENKPENAFLLLASKTTQMKCFQHAGTQPPPTTGSSGKLTFYCGIRHFTLATEMAKGPFPL